MPRCGIGTPAFFAAASSSMGVISALGGTCLQVKADAGHDAVLEGIFVNGHAAASEVTRCIDVRSAMVGHGEIHDAVAVHIAGIGKSLLMRLPNAMDDGRLARIARRAMVEFAAEVDNAHVVLHLAGVADYTRFQGRDWDSQILPNVACPHRRKLGRAGALPRAQVASLRPRDRPMPAGDRPSSSKWPRRSRALAAPQSGSMAKPCREPHKLASSGANVNELILRYPAAVSQFFGMPSRDESELCPLCKRGSMVGGNRQLAFRQKTDKGYVFCRVTIPMNICDVCGFMSWDDSAEATIEPPFVSNTQNLLIFGAPVIGNVRRVAKRVASGRTCRLCRQP